MIFNIARAFDAALFAPFRRVLDRQFAIEEAEMKLKAVTGDHFKHYVGLAHEFREDQEHASVTRMSRAITQVEALQIITQLVAAGYEPLSVEDVYTMDIERMAKGFW